MSVKEAVEAARVELDRKWIEKYPHGEMRLYLYIKGSYWPDSPLGPIRKSWVAEILSKRPTSRSRWHRAYNADGKMDDPPWALKHLMERLKKFSDPQKFIVACEAVGIVLPQCERDRLSRPLCE
jgi:hypothetical protein